MFVNLFLLFGMVNLYFENEPLVHHMYEPDPSVCVLIRSTKKEETILGDRLSLGAKQNGNGGVDLHEERKSFSAGREDQSVSSLPNKAANH